MPTDTVNHPRAVAAAADAARAAAEAHRDTHLQAYRTAVADQAAGRRHLVTRLNRRDHFLVLFLALLLRPNQQKIKCCKHQSHHDDETGRITLALCALCVSVLNEEIHSFFYFLVL